MNVLSLFDGISCGMVALERAGIPVERYVAYEIDPNAIKISRKNYPQIEHCGDVTTSDFLEYKGFDLLIGGSPCQDLSIANQKGEGLSGERSGLFWEYVRALEVIKPKYFLLENVASMKKVYRDKITEILGVEPIMINSALVSAQQRKRLYWTNIKNVVQPEDKWIFLKDILLDESVLPCALRTRKDYTGSYKRLEVKKTEKPILLRVSQQIVCTVNLYESVITIQPDKATGFIRSKESPLVCQQMVVVVVLKPGYTELICRMVTMLSENFLLLNAKDSKLYQTGIQKVFPILIGSEC